MDAFDDGFGGEGEVEVDPAAEFLAKEQEELGEIGEDLGIHSSGGQPIESGEAIQAFKEEEAEIPVAATGPNYAAFASDDQVQGMTSGMSGMTMREEPECIKKWKEEQEQMAKTRKANKEQEEAVTAGTEVNGIVPGQEWERVSKHCDFSAKAPGHTKDVSRMRSILLQLKQSPPTTRE